MLTPFGKFVRKLRIDQGHLLKDTADVLGVTSSYLSAVEKGKKAVPSEWIAKIALAYKLTSEQKAELTELATESAPVINLEMPSGTDDQTRKAVAMFARRINSLDKEALARIMALMEKQEKE